MTARKIPGIRARGPYVLVSLAGVRQVKKEFFNWAAACDAARDLLRDNPSCSVCLSLKGGPELLDALKMVGAS